MAYSKVPVNLRADLKFAYMAISEPMMLILYTRNLPQNLRRVIDSYQKV